MRHSVFSRGARAAGSRFAAIALSAGFISLAQAAELPDGPSLLPLLRERAAERAAARTGEPISPHAVATLPSWVAQSDQQYSNMGASVSVAGDVNGDGFSDVIVGTPHYSTPDSIFLGRADVFLGADVPASTPAWTVLGPRANTFLGQFVAPAGDVDRDGYDDILICAPDEFPLVPGGGGSTPLGVVRLFQGGPSAISSSPSWTVLGCATGDYPFDRPIAATTAGDVNGDQYADVLVAFLARADSAGPAADDPCPYQFAHVSLYFGGAAGLATSPAWASPLLSSQNTVCASTAGDVNRDGYDDVILGDPDRSNGQTEEGMVFLFYGSETGLGVSPGWSAESDRNFAHFGESVGWLGDMNGDGYSDFGVGSPRDNLGLGFEQGSVWLYFGSPGGPPAGGATLGLSGPAAGLRYGESVGTAGDVNGDGLADLVIGAPFYTNGQSNEGAVFLHYGRKGAVPSNPGPDVLLEGNRISTNFGVAAGTAGDMNGDGFGDVLAGAPFYDDGEVDEGAACVFFGAGDLPDPAASMVYGAHPGDSFSECGTSVASAGDLDGLSGISPNRHYVGDFVVGAPLHDGGGVDAGRVLFNYGYTDLTNAWTGQVEIGGDQAGARFGYSVSYAGDVDGNGFSEVLVGAPRYDNGQSDEGRVYVYTQGNAPAPFAQWIFECDQAGAQFGYAVANAGDVNGDGFADLLVGAPLYTNGQAGEGRAFLYQGSPSGLDTTPDWTAEPDQAQAFYASALAAAGDVNGDGFSDVIVGCELYTNGEAGEGRAFLYLGSATGLGAGPSWTAEGDQAGAFFGFAVATAGDVNGDGYSDVLVGAPTFDNGQPDEGRTFLYLGSPAGLAASPAWTFETDQDFSYSGYAVATAWDVNADGYGDALVGAPLYSNGQPNEGRVYLFTGSNGGLGPAPAWTAESDEAGAFLGYSVAGAGNVNADAASDILAGAIYAGNETSDDGAAMLFLGLGVDPGGGVWRGVRQVRPTGGTVVDLLGSMNHETQFGMQVPITDLPAGRTRAQPEYVLRPLGTPLSGIAPTRVGGTSWWDSGPSGDTVGFIRSELSPDVHYHWRARVVMQTPYFPHTPWVTASGSVPSLEQFKSKVTAVTDVAAHPAAGQLATLAVGAIRPNPFPAGRGKETTLRLSLARDATVMLAVFDVRGSRVASLHDGPLAAGEHDVRWNGRDANGRELPAGVYFARAEGGGATAAAKILLVR